MASNRQAQPAKDALVPLTNAQYFKLLEPIILFRALNDAVRQSSDDDVKYGATQSSPTVTTTGVEDRDDLFRAFVYKLAHICDSIKGGLGATITSFTILRSENPETRDTMVHYWFASNRRTTSQLDETKAYVHAILRKVHLAPRDTNAYKCNILRDIILFNRKKLSWYLGELSCSVRQCHSVIDKVFSTAGGPSQKDLAKILVAIDIPDFPVAEDDDATSAFVYGYERLMRRLTELENSDAGRDIAKHVRELPRLDRPSDECWHQFQHAMTRILAYPKSLQCILNARGEWPSLFAEYQIFYVQSSTAPIEKQWRSKSLTADGIVGRMARRQSEITRFREFTQQLQNCNLDTRIEAEFKRKTFKPIVHCEMLLLNFLEHSGGGITADRFFEAKRERMYIGSSKPLCKLCKFYFEEHGSGVGHRPTHNNLYTNWRLPDVAKSQGWAAKDGREKMLERMLKRVRADTFSLVMDKLPASGKYNDSNTFSANVSLYDDFSTIAADDLDDMTTMFGDVSVHDEYHEDGVFITTVPNRRAHNTGVSRAVPRGAGNYPSVAQSLLLSQSSITSRSS